ncbi:MAG: alpha/beta fold hydrolase [Gemmatimonadota bacterium]|nr:alpha/beta fold hydrolase [Gemmatimonadota bacterium]
MRSHVRPRLAVPLVTAALAIGLLSPELEAQDDPQDAARASEVATSADLAEIVEAFEDLVERQRHEHDVLRRQIDDLMFFLRLSDVAEVQMVTFKSGTPRWPESDGSLVYPYLEHEQGDSLTVPAYVFVPHDLDRSARHPLIVLVHGGVHSNHSSGTANVMREMLQQGYTIIAPEYRGSTGYGRDWYRQIDYGDTEVLDSYNAGQFALRTYPFLDEDRMAVVGWSHGGLHALFNIFRFPDTYAVAYAGVPVSDLVSRMGYTGQGYREQYWADYHLGVADRAAIPELRKRSPSWNTAQYQGTPLMITTNTNDGDVNVLEVERLIQALKADGKEGFRYRIYEDAPGGHSFDRRDNDLALQQRREMYEFLAEYLRPVRPMAYTALGSGDSNE